MVDVKLTLPPTPRVGADKKMSADERQRWAALERWTREVEQAFKTLQKAILELQDL